jgi:DNA polymerase-3 subunit epsilon
MKLKNDLVVLDVESTGVWIEKDKIIEVALLKYKPDGSKEVLHTKVNPGMAIPAHITELTGISDRDVMDCPNFKSLSRQVANFLENSDFGGYNIERFDLPLLQRELSDAGIAFAWDDRKIYDAQKVYRLNEKRDLSAAYQFYCGKDLVGAHSALADSEAVYAILTQQVAKYGEGRDDIGFLEKFEYISPMEFYDADRKFCWWNGKLYPSFGKFRRKLSLDEIARREPSYLSWLLKLDDMKEDARTLIENAMRGEFPVR